MEKINVGNLDRICTSDGLAYAYTHFAQCCHSQRYVTVKHDGSVHFCGLECRPMWPIRVAIGTRRVHPCCMQRGATALMWATLNGHSEIVEVLLKHGARVYLQDHVRQGEGGHTGGCVGGCRRTRELHVGAMSDHFRGLSTICWNMRLTSLLSARRRAARRSTMPPGTDTTTSLNFCSRAARQPASETT